MTYKEWCEKYIGPIVDQWNDGAITLEELTSAIFQTMCDKGVGTPDEWTSPRVQD